MPDFHALFAPDEKPEGPDFHSLFAPDEMSWGEVGQKAIENAPSDFMGVATGVISQLANPGGAGMPLVTNPDAIPALKEHYGNYTSIAGVKKNLSERPISTGLDVATVASPLKGGFALRTPKTPKLPTSAELKQGGGAALNVARDSGVYFTSEFVHPLRDTLATIAYEGGFRPGRRGTSELGQIMKDVDSMSDQPWDFRRIRELEQDLNDAWVRAKKGDNPSDTIAGIAGRQRAAVRQFMDQVEKGNTDGLYATADLTPEQAASIHQQGLKLYSTAKRAQKAETLRNLAENDASQFTQSGVANSIQKQARQILRQHHRGKVTGFDARDLETLKVLRDGQLTDWALQQARKYAGPMGTMIGAYLGGPIGAGAAWVMGKGVSKAADKVAMQRLNRFIETIQGEGSERLQALLGEAAHQHLMGTPRGRASVKNWLNKIATTGSKAAAKSLAAVLAQEVKQPSLAGRIEEELARLVQELQGSVETQAQPNEQ